MRLGCDFWKFAEAGLHHDDEVTAWLEGRFPDHGLCRLLLLDENTVAADVMHRGPRPSARFWSLRPRWYPGHDLRARQIPVRRYLRAASIPPQLFAVVATPLGDEP